MKHKLLALAIVGGLLLLTAATASAGIIWGN